MLLTVQLLTAGDATEPEEAEPAEATVPREPAADGTIDMTYEELVVVTRRIPRYPRAAFRRGLGDERCRVEVKIDEEGVPYDLQVAECNEAFHEPARNAIAMWRWKPPAIDGQPVKARTEIAVLFKAR